MGSAPSEILRRWRSRAFELITSTVILGELARVFTRPYFVRRLSDEERDRVLSLLRAQATTVRITRNVHDVATHPEDDAVLATAASAAADYLVTGDRQLCALGAFEGTLIVTPRQFLGIVGE